MPDENPQPAPDAPAFATSLKLTALQEKRLLDFVDRELDHCMKEMGRGTDGLTVAGSWLDKRRLNQLWYEGDLAWRTESYLGGVFCDSNFTRGDGKRYVRHMAAKISDDLLGTSPFFAAMKKDTGNDGTTASLIKAIEDFTQDGVEASNVPDILREAVELALVRNEAVVKLRNIFDATGYLGPADVLVDADGAPVITPVKKLYVYQNDDMLPVPGMEGMMALEKDASFVVSQEEAATMQYAHFEDLPQVNVQAEGLEARVLDPRDFITRLKVASIHDAPLVAHLYDESPARLKLLYGNFEVGHGYFGQPDSGEKAPIASQGEQRDTNCDDQWVPVAEVYVRFDADEDGQEENILLIIDRDATGKAIFYDYLHKHMKKRPFEVLHGLRKVPARWYGIGIYTDKFDQLVFVDKTFNRINLKASKTCTVTAVRRDAIEEWTANAGQITLGGDEILTLSTKWSADKGEWLEQKRLIEVTDEEREMMLTMTQSMDQEFGYISAADASSSGLNSSETATGIASIERSGNNIVKAVERVQMKCITAVLEQAVDILLENMDATRLALTKEAELLTLNQEEIRDMPREVKLLLTRSRSAELLATNEQATVKANEFFSILETNPRRAKALRPMYLAQLKALEVQDADDILPEVTDEDIAAFAQAQQAASAPQKPESLSISYKDAPDPIRRQMEAKAGMIPLTPEQEAQEAAMDAQQKAAKQPPKDSPAEEASEP